MGGSPPPLAAAARAPASQMHPGPPWGGNGGAWVLGIPKSPGVLSSLGGPQLLGIPKSLEMLKS